MMDDKTLNKQYLVDEELHNLLTTLRDLKETHANICKRLRAQGVRVSKTHETYFDKQIDDLSRFTSSIISAELIHNVQKGGNR